MVALTTELMNEVFEPINPVVINDSLNLSSAANEIISLNPPLTSPFHSSIKTKTCSWWWLILALLIWQFSKQSTKKTKNASLRIST